MAENQKVTGITQIVWSSAFAVVGELPAEWRMRSFLPTLASITSRMTAFFNGWEGHLLQAVDRQ